ncbi:MAG TPA: alpha/beta fold hydrolase BchO [Gemmatimonadaceae bacterium]|nr:alpha/beta fold hydrolase BchO [Gemmatimonadaceae bacterium]
MPDIEADPSGVPADWPLRESSAFINAAGLRWHVQRAGRGPVVVLVHGTAGATHTWRHVMPLLTASAEVIAFDLPGHGFTTGATPEQLSLDGMADAVRQLLRRIGVRPAIGVGHSAGAAVLLQLVPSHEVAPQSIIGVNSALVPINALGQFLQPATRAFFDFEPVRAAAAALLRNGTIARTLLRSTGTPLDAMQEARYVSLLTDDARVGAVLRMMSRWDLDALQATFPRVTLPVTLVHSRNEPWVAHDDLLHVTRTLPMRSVIDMTPAGHLIPDEKPKQLADVILSALASASRTG